VKPRRCGPMQGYSSWCWFRNWCVRFHRKNRWSPWRPVQVMATMVASDAEANAATALEDILVRRVDPKRVKSAMCLLTSMEGLQKFPMLKAFLTDSVLEYEGGKEAREPGTIYIQPRDGELAVTLKEPTQALLLRLQVPSIAAVWASIEAALDDPAAMWEADPWARRKKKKR